MFVRYEIFTSANEGSNFLGTQPTLQLSSSPRTPSSHWQRIWDLLRLHPWGPSPQHGLCCERVSLSIRSGTGCPTIGHIHSQTTAKMSTPGIDDPIAHWRQKMRLQKSRVKILEVNKYPITMPTLNNPPLENRRHCALHQLVQSRGCMLVWRSYPQIRFCGPEWLWSVENTVHWTRNVLVWDRVLWDHHCRLGL